MPNLLEGTSPLLPSCYVGPYAAYTRCAGHLFLFYNCCSTTGVLRIRCEGNARYYRYAAVRSWQIAKSARKALDLAVHREPLRSTDYTVNRETLARLADALRSLA